jgi:hypothetical protein
MFKDTELKLHINPVYVAILLACIIILIISSSIIPPVIFVDRHQFDNLVDQSDYFKKLTKEDLKYRNATTTLDYTNRYKNSYEKFTLRERLKIYYIIHHIDKLIPFKLKYTWKFAKIKTSDDLENGFPHTLGDVIVLTDTSLNYLDENFKSTLIHELVHIYQRKYSVDKNRLLQALGIYKESDLDQLDSMVNKPVDASNPDHDNQRYYIVLNGQKVYLSTIYDRKSNYGGDVLDIAYDKMGNQIPIAFQPDVAYQGQPNEIMAELVARVILGKPNVRPDWYNTIKVWLYT